MASSDNDVYLAENFDVFKEVAANLTQNKCPGTKTFHLLCQLNYPIIR